MLLREVCVCDLERGSETQMNGDRHATLQGVSTEDDNEALEHMPVGKEGSDAYRQQLC